MTRPFRLTTEVTPEHQVQVDVIRALRRLLPSDAVVNAWDLANAKSKVEGFQKKERGCLAGWPDLGVFWQGRVVLMELKRERGWRLSEPQRELHPRLEATGFPVAVVHNAGDALRVVKAAGVPLRGRIMA